MLFRYTKCVQVQGCLLVYLNNVLYFSDFLVKMLLSLYYEGNISILFDILSIANLGFSRSQLMSRFFYSICGPFSLLLSIHKSLILTFLFLTRFFKFKFFSHFISLSLSCIAWDCFYTLLYLFLEQFVLTSDKESLFLLSS